MRRARAGRSSPHDASQAFPVCAPIPWNSAEDRATADSRSACYCCGESTSKTALPLSLDIGDIARSGYAGHDDNFGL